MDSIREIFELLEEFEKILIRSCEALTIDSNPISSPPLPSTPQLPIPDEFSWFFDDDTIPSLQPATLQPNHDLNVDVQLYCGLQHTLWWEFEWKEDKQTVVQYFFFYPYFLRILKIVTDCRFRCRLRGRYSLLSSKRLSHQLCFPLLKFPLLNFHQSSTVFQLVASKVAE